MERDPIENSTSTNHTSWTSITDVFRSPSLLQRMTTDMLYLIAGDLGVAPPRLSLTIEIVAPEGVEAADGVRMNFNVTLSLDGVRLSETDAVVVEARLQRAVPTFRRVADVV